MDLNPTIFRWPDKQYWLTVESLNCSPSLMARDAKGALAATGVYFYRIVAGEAFVETRKMVLMK